MKMKSMPYILHTIHIAQWEWGFVSGMAVRSLCALLDGIRV